MIWYVYLLVDPRDGEIRYVGGSKSPKTRLRFHMWESLNNRPKYQWLKGLKDIGLKPNLEILLSYDKEREMIEDEISTESLPRGYSDDGHAHPHR